MSPIAPKWTLSDIRGVTNWNKTTAQRAIKNAILYLSDDKKKERRKSFRCKTCYYIHGYGEDIEMACAAMTNWGCRCCEKKYLYGHDSVPKICLTCAVDFKLCMRCGGDLEDKIRKRYKDERSRLDKTPTTN